MSTRPRSAAARRELAAVERRLAEILKALGEGYRSEAWKSELARLDARKAELTAAVAEPAIPALHPQMAEVYRRKATTLAAGLEHDEQRDAARQALRGFLDRIVIPPGEGLLQVIGNLGSMLAAAQGGVQSGAKAVGYVGCGGTQPTLSAALAPCCLTSHGAFTRLWVGGTGRCPHLAHPRSPVNRRNTWRRSSIRAASSTVWTTFRRHPTPPPATYRCTCERR